MSGINNRVHVSNDMYKNMEWKPDRKWSLSNAGTQVKNTFHSIYFTLYHTFIK